MKNVWFLFGDYIVEDNIAELHFYQFEYLDLKKKNNSVEMYISDDFLEYLEL